MLATAPPSMSAWMRWALMSNSMVSYPWVDRRQMLLIPPAFYHNIDGHFRHTCRDLKHAIGETIVFI
jgi:hypothetical protein